MSLSIPTNFSMLFVIEFFKGIVCFTCVSKTKSHLSKHEKGFRDSVRYYLWVWVSALLFRIIDYQTVAFGVKRFEAKACRGVAYLSKEKACRGVAYLSKEKSCRGVAYLSEDGRWVAISRQPCPP